MIVEDYFPYKTAMWLIVLEYWNYNEIPVLCTVSQFNGVEEVRLSALTNSADKQEKISLKKQVCQYYSYVLPSALH